MENIRSIIVGVVSLAVAALFVVVMATVGLAVIGIAAVVAATGFAIALIRGRGRLHRTDHRDGPRVWNDGRGTIIDL